MSSRAVIRSYLTLASLYTLSASVIWGVNTLFLLDAGLDIFEVFIANAVFTASMALFEIPTGVLADSRGRRVSFLLSLVVVLIGTVGYVAVARAGGGLVGFALMSVVLGLGYTFYSGAMEAWLVDALRASGYNEGLDPVFARGSLVTGAAMLVGSVGGGLLGQIDLAVPFLVRAALLAVVLVVAALTMHDRGFTPRAMRLRELPGEMRRLAQASITYGWRTKPVRLLIVGTIIQMGFGAWAFYAWQPYLLELLGRELIWAAGVIAAMVSLATMLGNSIVAWVTRFCGKRTTLLLWSSAVATVAAVVLGAVPVFAVALAALLVMMAAWGVAGPVKQAFMHQLIPSAQRATVVSFDSLMGSAGSVVGQTTLGRLAQTQSLASGYIFGGAVTVLVLPVMLLLRRLGSEGDLIRGKPRHGGGCAAQGLPTVSQVHAKAPAES